MKIITSKKRAIETILNETRTAYQEIFNGTTLNKLNAGEVNALSNYLQDFNKYIRYLNNEDVDVKAWMDKEYLKSLKRKVSIEINKTKSRYLDETGFPGGEPVTSPFVQGGCFAFGAATAVVWKVINEEIEKLKQGSKDENMGVMDE